MGNPQSGGRTSQRTSTGSIVTMIEAQLRYVADALGKLQASGAKAIDVKPAAQERSTAKIRKQLQGSVWTQCNNWYVHDGHSTNNWPTYMTTYIRETRELEPAEYEFIRASA